jgi:hypothetical protein
VAVATRERDFTDDTLTAPMGTEPSTSMSRAPRYRDSDPHQARPAANAASRSVIPVLAAQAEVIQLFAARPAPPT